MLGHLRCSVGKDLSEGKTRSSLHNGLVIAGVRRALLKLCLCLCIALYKEKLFHRFIEEKGANFFSTQISRALTFILKVSVSSLFP